MVVCSYLVLLTILCCMLCNVCGGEQVRTDTRDTSLLLLLLLVFAVGASGYVLREGMKEVSATVLRYCYAAVFFILHTFP
jgi:hypothetical protein